MVMRDFFLNENQKLNKGGNGFHLSNLYMAIKEDITAQKELEYHTKTNF